MTSTTVIELRSVMSEIEANRVRVTNILVTRPALDQRDRNELAVIVSGCTRCITLLEGAVRRLEREGDSRLSRVAT